MSSSNDTSVVEGVEMSVVHVGTASGCGGYDGGDADAKGRDLYVRKGLTGDGEFEETLTEWRKLWPRRWESRKGETRERIAALGVTVPDVVAEVVAWDDNYLGTRAEWEKDAEKVRSEQRAYENEMEMAASLARAAFLTRRGWYAVRSWLGESRTMVFDRGCRCAGGYGYGEGGLGRGTLRVLDKVVYFVRDGTEIGAAFESAKLARREAEERARAEFASALVEMSNSELITAARLRVVDGDLTHHEWEAQLEELARVTRERLVKEMSEEDYSGVASLRWPGGRQRSTPSFDARRAYERVLEDSGVEIVSLELVEDLVALFSHVQVEPGE